MVKGNGDERREGCAMEEYGGWRDEGMCDGR